MARRVRFRVLDGVAVVTIEAPPVNALSTDVRAGLWEAFGRVADNDAIKAVVLTAAGRLFSAGADIREFKVAPTRQPTLPQLCQRIEDCPKPVVAAAHGQALGGGAELMLAAHYRMAAPQTRIALPEVALGLVPGAGGTQRLPRLIGVDRALQMMLSASAVDAQAAQRIGLIDGLVDGDIASGAIAFATALIAAGKGPRPTRDIRTSLADGRAYAAAIRKARGTFANTPLHAPHRLVDCVEAASLLPFEAGMAFEADAFERCLAHPQSIALRHVFSAERRTDEALIERDGAAFRPVAPMGKAAVLRLQSALRAAAEEVKAAGASEADIDGAMVAYGFRSGPFGGQDAGQARPDIVDRLIAALVAEGGLCVEQGAVQRPADIDVLAVHGLGFPRRHGGPMRAAQTAGLIPLRKNMRIWSQDSEIWTPPAILDEAIKDARGFDAVG